MVTRALADLDLSSSIELVSARGFNNEYQHSIISYDTAELLRTPSPCMVESDQEAEPVETENAGVEARDGSSEENIEKHQGKQDQCAALNHKENGQGFCMQVNSGIQPVADVPATSTPKKQKALSSDSPQIVEGRYKGSAYHRDGTRVGGYYNFFKFFHSKSRDCVTYRKKTSASILFFPDVQCDVCRINLPDGTSMFCVWMSRPSQQGTLLQTDDSLHNHSGASLGEVSASKDV